MKCLLLIINTAGITIRKSIFKVNVRDYSNKLLNYHHMFSITTKQELKHELSNNGEINLKMVKQMMRVMLEIIEEKDKQIASLNVDIEILVDRTDHLKELVKQVNINLHWLK